MFCLLAGCRDEGASWSLATLCARVCDSDGLLCGCICCTYVERSQTNEWIMSSLR